MTDDKSTLPAVSEARAVEKRAAELQARSEDLSIPFVIRRSNAYEADRLRTQAKALRASAKAAPPARHFKTCDWIGCAGCGPQIDPRSLSPAQLRALRYLVLLKLGEAGSRPAPRPNTMFALFERGLVTSAFPGALPTREGVAVLRETGTPHLADRADEWVAPRPTPGEVSLVALLAKEPTS